MTVALAIAVLVLAVGLIYLLITRQEQPAEQPDLTPAIQEAARHATAQAMSEALPTYLQANKEAREVDVKTAEAALDKRQAEIKSLAERIADGQKKIEEQVQRRGETDLRTQALLEQMGQTIGNLNSETAGLKKALRQPQTRGQWGELQLRRCVEIAGMTEHVDFELQATLRTEDGRSATRRDLPAAGRPQLRRRLEGPPGRLPRRPGGGGRSRAQDPPPAPRPAGAPACAQPQLQGLPGAVQAG